MKKLLLALLSVIVILLIIVLFNTFTTKSKQVQVEPVAELAVSDSAVVHLQQAISFKTVSQDNRITDTNAFNAFHSFLRTAYPLLFEKGNVEFINKYSLLFHIKGKEAKHPIILMGHQDVVPVEEASLAQWSVDPFSGMIKNDTIYGRGAVDDKGSVIAILEATEMLLREGFVPSTDIYLAFGHDEEASGQNGGKALAALLKQRNIQPAFVMDEGGEITDHEIPGMHEPVALVGIAEKGYATLDLSVNIPGSHSSMPAKQTAIDVLADAVAELKRTPFRQTLQFTSSFMDYTGPEMPFVNRMAFANRWLFSPMIKNIYSKSPGADAMTRTTTAPTLFNSGIKENVIPTVATATINFRTLPTTTVDDVVKHVRDVVNDDRIKITVRPNPNNVQAVADVNHSSFTHIQKTIRSWRPDVKVTPYLVLGATDGRFFTILTPQVYRFIPFNDVKGFHGINERVGVKEYKKGVAFYYWLMKKY
jgi:carboxypeptidase PM20D1